MESQLVTSFSRLCLVDESTTQKVKKSKKYATRLLESTALTSRKVKSAESAFLACSKINFVRYLAGCIEEDKQFLHLAPGNDSLFALSNVFRADIDVKKLFSGDPLFSKFSDFCAMIPKDLVWNVSDIFDFKKFIQIRPWIENECYQIIMQKNPNNNCYFLFEVRDPVTETQMGITPFLKVSFLRDKSVNIEGAAKYILHMSKIVELITKFKSLLSHKILSRINDYEDVSERVVALPKPVEDPQVRRFELVNQYENFQPMDALANFVPHRGMQEISAFNKELFYSPNYYQELYEAVNQFFSKVSVAEIHQVFYDLKHHPKIQKAHEKFEDILAAILEQQGHVDTLKSVEDQLIFLQDLKANGHKIGHNIKKLHELFCEIFKGYKNSIFLTLAIENLKRKNLSLETLLIVTEILEEIPIIDVSKDIRELEKRVITLESTTPVDIEKLEATKRALKFLVNYSSQSQISIIYDLLNSKKILLGNLQWLYTREILQIVKDPENGIARKKWRQQSFDTSIEAYITAVLHSLQWICNLSASDFQQIAPGLSCIDIWVNSQEPNLKYFLRTLQRDEGETFLQEMINHLNDISTKTLIKLIEYNMKKTEKFDSNKFYILWSLAKMSVDSG